jgi:DNA repair ATPase RecN
MEEYNKYNKYKHDECIYEEINEIINIECYDCINKIKTVDCCKSTGSPNSYIDCKCYDKTIIKKICKKCNEIQDEINVLKNELDDVLYMLSYDIQNYKDCEYNINRLHNLSKMLREYNSLLLEKM